MSSATPIVFPPFRLDVRNQQLWRDEVLVPVRPKPFVVLAYLATHPGRLVTAAELRKAVWPNTYVGEGLLRGYIREARLVLGDDPETPQFIETVPRRGYRFLAEVASSPPSLTQHSAPSTQHPVLVGRERELTQLHGWFAKAVSGERQLVFVTGEPGIGKTTLIDAFLLGLGPEGTGNGPPTLSQREPATGRRPQAKPSVFSPLPDALSPAPGVWVGRGQCIEHYGSGEAYLPVLEAVGQLCRQPGGEHVVALLRRYAPTWLVQLPALVSDAEFEALQRKVQGAVRERMLREMAEMLEALTATQPLVLVLEDLHWCDYSTLDLLGALARRREPARLLVIGSYRPADVIVSNHPLRGLKQELQSHQQCHELALSFLTQQSVAAYLDERFARGATNDTQALHALARVIHQQSDGNPLFMVGLINYWMQEGALPGTDEQQRLDKIVKHAQHGIPDGLRQMVEHQLDRLSDEEQQLLEVASVAGEEFLTAAVSIGNDAWKESSEERYEELAARGQFVRFRQLETLPDGALTSRYRFLHALYQKIVYERLTTVRRTRLHRALGERLEQLWSVQAREHAMELAAHFERGQENQRAVQYLWQAAENARGKHAYQETVAILRKGVDLLKTQPDTVARAQQELALLVMLGVSLLMTKGYAAAEVEQTYARAHQLCQNVGNSPQLLPALAGLFRFYFVRAKFSLAQEFAEQALSLAQQTSDHTVFLIAHCLLATLSTTRGRFLAAREHFDEGFRLYDPQRHPVLASIYGDDPGVICRSLGGFNLWFLGYPDQALQHAQAGLALAHALALPYNLTFALDIVTWIHFYRGEPQAAKTCLASLLPLVHEQGFEFFAAESALLQGWVMAEQGREDEGLAQMHAGVNAYHATGAKMSRPTHLGLLAKTYGKMERRQEGLAVIAEAFVALNETGECCLEAELWRLHGELILQKGKEESQKRRGKSGKHKGNRASRR